MQPYRSLIGNPFQAVIIHSGIAGIRTVIVYNPCIGDLEAMECNGKDICQIPISGVQETPLTEIVDLKY